MTFPACNPHAVRYRGWRRAIPMMVLAFGLIGCSTYQNVIDKFKDPIILKCPDYRVIADAANLTKFKDGPGRDLIDVDFEGKITSVQLACLSDIEKKNQNRNPGSCRHPQDGRFARPGQPRPQGAI